jgi:ABC-2 type transport system ATP-binding protein
VLDEPMAMLDPLARHDFMARVMTAMAEDGVSVVLSSHVLAELERVADHLILLSRGRLQVAGKVRNLLDRHQVLTGPAITAAKLAAQLPPVHIATDDDLARILVSSGDQTGELPEGWRREPASLEEMVLGYLREPSVSALPEAEEVLA